MAQRSLLPAQDLGQRLRDLLRGTDAIPLPWNVMLWTELLAAWSPALTVLGLREATFGGYSRVPIDRAQWGAPVVTDDCAKSVWGNDPITWTSTGGPTQAILGVAYLTFDSSALVKVEQFADEDVLTVAPGDRFQYRPFLTLTSAEC